MIAKINKREVALGTLPQLPVRVRVHIGHSDRRRNSPSPDLSISLDRNGICVTDAQFLSRLNIAQRVELNSTPNSTLLDVQRAICVLNTVRRYENQLGKARLTMIEVQLELGFEKLY